MDETPGHALQDFEDGFTDGYAGRPRQKRRGGQYLRSYKRGEEAKLRSQNGGEDTGLAPRARRQRHVAKVA